MTAAEDSLESKVEMRSVVVVHPSCDAPLCSSCHQRQLPFFDPSCDGCLALLESEETTIANLFAIIRQWTPHTQQNIERLVKEMLKRGANVNDRDGLTDMSLLQYACKAGAPGVGDPAAATRTVGLLLDRGADVRGRCRWTDMAPIHYAAYFDVPPVLELLLKASRGADVDSRCGEFEGGAPLHIAAANLCAEAAKVLLEHHADPTLADYAGRMPCDCVPDFPRRPHPPDLTEAMVFLKELLSVPSRYEVVGSKAVLQAMGVRIGDKVVVGGAKVGTLRYCGGVHFAQGTWAGVELEEPLGKNDGTLEGTTYFRCESNHGIFAPLAKISKGGQAKKSPRSPRSISFSRVNLSHVTSKIETGLRNKAGVVDLVVGDRILVSGRRKGTVRFAGETHFASGLWYGIELDKPQGKNDGSIRGVEYFQCPPGFGLFAPPHRIARLEEDLSDQDSADMSKSSTEGEKKNNCWLTVGINVFVNNEIGCVRYVGPVSFAEGTWLGVELRSPKGKNDGSVQGKSYFSCRPGHGLLVRPNRVTVRGINGAKLIQET